MKKINKPSSVVSFLLSLILVVFPTFSFGGQGDWPYTLSEDQIQMLREAGNQFDEEDKLLASRLVARGFSADLYVKAYQEWAELEPKNRADVEIIAEFLELGLPLSEFDIYKIYHERGMTLTQYYNKRIGGKAQVVGGWVATGFGVVDVVVGSIFLLAKESLAEAYPRHTLGDDPKYWETAGTVILIIGGLVTIVGLSILAKGKAKTRRWAPLGTLENGDVQTLRKYRIKSAASSIPPIQLTLSPFVTGDGGGFSLRLKF